MHLKLDFTLIFESDWHINAGFGMDGKTDAVIERTPQNKPIISGTTLKGVFRDALYDLARNLGKETPEFTEILGTSGQGSHWHFSAATLDPTSKNIGESVIATGVRVDPRYRRAEDNKYFTRELGAAEKFTFSVTGTVNDSDAVKEVEVLVAAAAYIERLGGRRRRGSGKCIIALAKPHLQEELLASFENRYFGGDANTIDISDLKVSQQTFEFVKPKGALTNRYRIIVYTERPVIVAEKPESGNIYQSQFTIPGTTLRGAFAELAHPSELNTDDYKRFKELFVLGGLKFSHLNPMEVSDGMGVPVAQLPMGLQKDEEAEDRFTSVFRNLTDQKAFTGWMQLQNGHQKASFKTEAHPHVGINPDLKRASDGDLYTYEAIPAGRYYAGELYLVDKDWQRVSELLKINLNTPFELRIGKGRNRSYGLVNVVVVPMADSEPPTWIHAPLETRLKATTENELYITLATDTIIQDVWGRFYGRFEPAWLAQELETSDFQILPVSEAYPSQVVRTKLVESFDARSGLPRWRDKALIAGSTARIVFNSGNRPSVDVLKRIENEGIGLRRSEGFGRVVFNHPAHTKWVGFAESIAIPNELPLPEHKITGQERFINTWTEILNGFRINQYQYLWTAKYEAVAHSIAYQLMETLNQKPERVLANLQSSYSTETSDKDSAKRYQEITEFVHSKLQEVFEKRRNYWHKAVILLAEALINNREKA